MAKHIFILSALILLHVYIEAAPNADNHDTERKSGENLNIEQTDPKVDSQGQRQKRFNNYFNFGFSPYDSYIPSFVKRDQSQETGNFGADISLSVISRQVNDILKFTREGALSRRSYSHFQIPSYIPVLYFPRYNCGCRHHNNETPNNDEEYNTNVPLATSTTTTAPRTTSKPQTMPPAPDNVPTISPPNDDTTITSPDFSVRLPDTLNSGDDDDSEDGTRPISFVPKKPKRPLSRPPPPVDHGSKQEGNDQVTNDQVTNNEAQSSIAFSTTISPPAFGAVAAQPHLPTNAIPTLCDGAVLTCCHRLEVTYECFLQQGCENPTPYDSPCDNNVIFDVIRKFQYYYANRRG